MPNAKPPKKLGAELPDFTPKAKKSPGPKRGDKSLQLFVSYHENSELELLIQESGITKGGYLRCLVRHAIQAGLKFDKQGHLVEDPARKKKEG
jgi:hypothetical protein